MSTKVYFGKLSRDVREKEKLATEFGRVRDVRLLQGFAFIDYQDHRDAKDACKALDGTKFLGTSNVSAYSNSIICELAKGNNDRGRDSGRGDDRRDRDRDYDRRPVRRVVKNESLRVTVTNLPSSTTWQELKDLMRKAGEVQYTNVEGGKGIVEFEEKVGKEKAIDMFGAYEYNGTTIGIRDDYEGKGDRSPAGRDRSRSPRRDRSRSRDKRDRSRSPKKSRSRSRDKRERSRSPAARRARSRSPRRERSKSPKKDRSPVASRDRSPKRDRSPRRERSKSRSKSPKRDRSPKRRESSSKRRQSSSPDKMDVDRDD